MSLFLGNSKITPTRNAEIIALSQEIMMLSKENTELKNNGLIGTRKGENIYISDSAEARFSHKNSDGLVIKGNSKQDMTKGKNLLKLFSNNTSITNNGVTITINSDNTITLNGTCTSSIYLEYVYKIGIGTNQQTEPKIILDSEKTYTFSMEQKSGTFNGDFYSSLQITENNASKSTRIDTTSNFTSATGIYRGYIFIQQDCVFNNLVIGLQLEEGTEATEYEPYTGGQSSPNPDYPQEIHSVGDNGSASVTIGNKNLFDKTKGTMNSALDSKGIIYGNNNWNVTDFIQVEYGDTIRFWNSSQQFTVTCCNKDKEVIKALSKLNSVLIDDVNIKYIRTDCRKTEIDNYMIYKGDIPQDYIPHAHQTYIIPTQQPMRKIGDYADTFVQENGVWYEKHVIDKVVFNGRENWSTSTTYPGSYYLGWTNTILKPTHSFSQLYCNYFRRSNINNLDEINEKYAKNTLFIESEDGIINIWWGDNTTTVENFKEWLSTHNIELIYELKNPILLQCTPEQITILEQMYNEAKTYKDGTHVYSTDEISPYFEVEYYQDISKEIAEIQQAIIELGGII